MSVCWHAITVVGAERTLRAFVAGFEAGREHQDPVLFADDAGIRESTLAERVHDVLAARSHHLVLAPDGAAAALVAALNEMGRDVDLLVGGRTTVLSAALDFKAEVFSEELAAKVRSELCDSLPPDVTVERSSGQERHEDDARGVELYAPEHAFSYRVSGRVAGALPGVLEMRRRALEFELVTVEPITLVTGALAEPTGR